MLSCIFACLANCMWQRFFFSLNRNNLSTLDTWSVLKKSLTVMTRLKKTSSISLPERLFVSNAATWNVMKRQSARASQSHAKLSTPPRGALSYRPAVLLKKKKSFFPKCWRTAYKSKDLPAIFLPDTSFIGNIWKPHCKRKQARA